MDRRGRGRRSSDVDCHLDRDSSPMRAVQSMRACRSPDMSWREREHRRCFLMAVDSCMIHHDRCRIGLLRCCCGNFFSHPEEAFGRLPFIRKSRQYMPGFFMWTFRPIHRDARVECSLVCENPFEKAVYATRVNTVVFPHGRIGVHMDIWANTASALWWSALRSSRGVEAVRSGGGNPLTAEIFRNSFRSRSQGKALWQH
jgi:hypothetical protein